MQRLFSEYVLLETLQDNTLNDELSRFNTAKEAMFNDVMRRLGLPYQFKWVLSTPSRAESAKAVMASLIPPSQEWWEDNCVFADGSGIPDLAPYLRYCSLQSKFEKYWPLIQHMYFFLTKYETMRYVTPDREIPFPPEYWRAGRKLYADVRHALETDMADDEFESFFQSVKKSFK